MRAWCASLKQIYDWSRAASDRVKWEEACRALSAYIRMCQSRPAWHPPTDSTRITSDYEEDRGKDGIHYAVDIGGVTPRKKGDKIYAVTAGVIQIIPGSGWNTFYLIADSGEKIGYLHCDVILWDHGQRVNPGDVVALMGDTGSAGQVHLHFQVQKDGKWVNPLDYYPFVSWQQCW